ncbi:hypothetical protein LTR37_001473 [Vermiconidia calcicola]|uniref:Uncharacterized protein n=1 Tax=Vermiconidia calcicola TaxID=1690605 RepID=A0ACC3NVU7_9PEZI|nr:hypothetical protein LTR37_001473 [Vermiconidia calcicola]
MAAATQVLQTVELFERVLAQVPCLDLVCAKRTSKHFKAVIDGSIALRKKLYLHGYEEFEIRPRWNHMIFQTSDEMIPRYIEYNPRNLIFVTLDKHTLERKDSFYDMHVTQPPAKKVRISFGVVSPVEYSWKSPQVRWTMTNEAGVRWKAVLDEVIDTVENKIMAIKCGWKGVPEDVEVNIHINDLDIDRMDEFDP